MYETSDRLSITENHLRVLELFTRGFDREYYIREVHKMLGISPRTAQLILDDLERKSVLLSQTRGKIKTYAITKNVISREYLAFVEQYKKISFLQSNHLIREVIEKITPLVRGIMLVFGSYAKGTQKKGSDLDVFIAGRCYEKRIGDIGKMYGVEISIKRYPPTIFKKNIATDHLVKEVLTNHIVISGVEELVSAVASRRCTVPVPYINNASNRKSSTCIPTLHSKVSN